MRLTLRTLLAYIDHVLNPNDARELANKIRESKLAQNTMERIDKGLANRNMNSPTVNAKKGVKDPNIVAEYLDNTLRPEDVPQFERMCFENDTQLIETASVHRILTAALTVPTNISPELMERLKSLQGSDQQHPSKIDSNNTSDLHQNFVSDQPSSNEATPAKSGQVLRVDIIPTEISPDSSTGPLFTAADANSRSLVSTPSTHGLDLSEDHTNSVPEYLRDRSRIAFLQYVLVATLLVGLGFLFWKIIGPLDQVTQLFEQSTIVAQQPSNSALAEDLDTAPEQSASNITVAESAAPTAPANVASTEVAPANVAPIVESDVAPPSAETVTMDSASAQELTPIVGEDFAPPPVSPSVAASSTASTTETAAAESSNSDTKMSESPIQMDNAAPLPPSAESPINVDNAAPIQVDNTSPIPIDNSPASDSHSPLASASDIPNAIVWQPETKESSNAVVMALSSDEEGNPTLKTVNIAESVPLTSRVIVPDAYRTELRIAPGLKWTVASATDLQLEQGDTPKAAHVKLRIGKAIVSATADCSSFVLRVGSQEFKVVMESPTAVASVEVKYFPRAGIRIENVASELQADQNAKVISPVLPVVTLGSVVGKVQVFTKQGVSWSVPDDLTEGTLLAFVDGDRKRPMIFTEAPWWYRTSIERPIDAGAAEDLALELQVPAEEVAESPTPGTEEAASNMFDALVEATKVRRSETAALAARTLAIVGRYDGLFQKDSILNHANSRPHRSLILESVVQSLGVDPMHCVDLAETLADYDPPRGVRILAMLSLPDAKTLSKPEGSQMFLDGLASSFLDERVIAIHQLVKITGKEYTYQPDRVTNDALAQWRKIQTAGRINYNSASAKPLDWGSE